MLGEGVIYRRRGIQYYWFKKVARKKEIKRRGRSYEYSVLESAVFDSEIGDGQWSMGHGQGTTLGKIELELNT